MDIHHSLTPDHFDKEIEFLHQLRNHKGEKIHFIGTCQISLTSVNKSEKHSSIPHLIRTIRQINLYLENKTEAFFYENPSTSLKNLKNIAEKKLQKQQSKQLPNESIKELKLVIAELASKILALESFDSAQTKEQPSALNLSYQTNMLSLKIEDDEQKTRERDEIYHSLEMANQRLISTFNLSSEESIFILSDEDSFFLKQLTEDIASIPSLHEKFIQSDEGKKLFLNKTTDIMRNLAIVYNIYSDSHHLGLQVQLSILAEAIEFLQNLVSSVAVFNAHHALYELEKMVLNSTQQQVNRQFGAHYTGFGGEHVKGGHLHADIRQVDGKELLTLDFKISHFTRNNLQPFLQFIATHSSQKEKDSHSNLITDQMNLKIITVNDKEFKYFYERDEQGNYSRAKGYTPTRSDKQPQYAIIEFGNLGRVTTVGLDPEMGTMYDRVKLELDIQHLEGKNALNEISKMLGSIGLGEILIPQSGQDEERIKIFQLFKIFYPLEAIPFYTKEQYYKMSIEELKIAIIDAFSNMKGIFKEFLTEKGMKKIEIFPGKTVWFISNFSDLLREQGAWGLTCGLTGKGRDDIQEAAKTIALVLKSGMLSSENRFDFGSFIEGASAHADFASGGASQTFFRLVNSKQSTHNPSNYPWQDYASQVYFRIKLEALQNGNYCLKDDVYGRKNLFSSLNAYRDQKLRGTLIKDCNKIDENWEVMVKDRVQPEHIAGILIYEKDKEKLIQSLIKLDVIVEGKIQISPNLSIDVNDFIQVKENFDKNMF